MNLLRGILDLVYPPSCEICGFKLTPYARHICNYCLKKIRINSPPFCKYCSRHLGWERKLCKECIGRKSYLEQAWSWGIYDDMLKRCLHLYKYKKEIYLLDLFKKPLLEFIEQNSIMKNIDLIVPVPLHPAKLKERTFNQSQTIAVIFSKYFKTKTEKALKKIRSTEPQNKLNKNQRRWNVKGVFAVKKRISLYEKNILLVDDIFTTGSTLNECAKTLLKAGAKKVYGFTLARGL